MNKSFLVICVFFGLLLGSQAIVIPDLKISTGILSQTKNADVVFDPGDDGETSLCAVQTTTRLAGIGFFGQRSWALSSDSCQNNLAGITGDSLQKFGVFESLDLLPLDRPVWNPVSFASAFELWLYLTVLWLLPRPMLRRGVKKQIAALFHTQDRDTIRFIGSFLLLVRSQKSLSLSQWNYIYSVCFAHKLKGEELLKMESVIRQLPASMTIKDVLRTARFCSKERRAELYDIASNLLSANGHASAEQIAQLSILSKLSVPQTQEDRRLCDLQNHEPSLVRAAARRA